MSGLLTGPGTEDMTSRSRRRVGSIAITMVTERPAPWSRSMYLLESTRFLPYYVTVSLRYLHLLYLLKLPFFSGCALGIGSL